MMIDQDGNYIPDYANPNQTPMAQPVPAQQLAPAQQPVTPLPPQQPTAPVQQPAPLPQLSPMQAAAAYMSPEELAVRAATRVVPGRPAVTQEQLEQAAKSGTFVPQSEAHGVVGANTAAYEDIQKIQDARIEAAHQQAIAEKLQANANLDNSAAAAAEAQKRASVETLMQQQRENDWNDQYAQLQQQMAPENNRINPTRYFSNAGVLGSALAIIGAGFEARAAARRGTPNPQTLMKLIDNDIRTQQLEMMRKGQAANNQLALLSQQWGSIESGRQALKVAQLDEINSKLKDAALQESDPATKAAIDAKVAETDAMTSEETSKLKAMYGGQESMQVQGAVMRPQKAQAGGVVLDYGKLAEEGRKNIELGIKADQQRHGTGEQSDQGRAERLGGKLAELNQILKLQEDYNKSVGIEMNPKTGQYEQVSDHPLYGPADTVRGWFGGHVMSKRANEAARKRGILAEAHGRSQSGAAISKTEQENFDTQVGGTSEADAAAAANALRASILAKMEAIRAGAGQGASQIYDENKRNERNRQHALSGVEPYQPQVK
jgi:hypothetical protein